MNYADLITRRKSIREFHSTGIMHSQQAVIRGFFNNECHRLIPDLDMELLLLDKNYNAGDKMEGMIGYGGYAFHAPLYLIILSDHSPYRLYNGGYMGEDMILKLTDMGLSTCYLTVSRGDIVKEILNIDSPKDVVSVIAAGYGKKERVINRIDIVSPSNVNFVSVEGHIAPKIAEDEMVWYDRIGEKVPDWSYLPPSLDTALYHASLAPSYLNRQPYRYLIAGKYLLVLEKQDIRTSTSDVQIDLGITMLNYTASISQSNMPNAVWHMGVPEDLPDIGDTSEYKPTAWCAIGE